MALRLVISGCGGRMGRAIASLATQNGAFTIGGALEAAGHQAAGAELSALLGRPVQPAVRVETDATTAFGRGDVVIEFTQPEATVQHAQLAVRLGKPMVIGTTGLSADQMEALRAAARTVALVVSPNMSLGVNVLFELAQTAAQRLGAGYDVAVVEAHHRHKQDAPSGTAKRLAAGLAAARGQANDAIPVHAVRAGDIVGDHTVILAGPAERLELTHRAHSRDVFAQGALQAALFVSAQPPGLYDMSHVLRRV